jgi:hypothetical protein
MGVGSDEVKKLEHGTDTLFPTICTLIYLNKAIIAEILRLRGGSPTEV